MAIDPGYQALRHASERMPYEHPADADHLVEGITLAMEYTQTR